jgi:hypothetical protein
MPDGYTLEKWTWTEEDFERMGWHDALVHAFSFQPGDWELLMDLDYILQWVDPAPGEGGYRFWSAPATLVFADVADLRIELEPFPAFELADISRSDPQASDTREDTPSSVHWLWTLDFHNGRVTFRSTGFTQSFRRPPVFNSSQSLTLEERGGLSFERGRTGERAT